jgi:16S rRNA (uracil1498-N3)-methyltransferase
MGRFHLPPERVRGDLVEFDSDETHHLVRVLRLRPGDVVQALDGRGLALTVQLTTIGSRHAKGHVLARSQVNAESPLALTLVQSIPKGDKMETIVRMATELGVERVAPVLTERTVVRMDGVRWGERAQRWQRVAQEAAKQSGRSVVPVVQSPRSFERWFTAESPGTLVVCLHEAEERPLSCVLPAPPVRRVALVVGPEGGLSQGEIEILRAGGALVAGLGPRILRTETAGPVGLALLQARYGDLGTKTVTPGPAGPSAR